MLVRTAYINWAGLVLTILLAGHQTVADAHSIVEEVYVAKINTTDDRAVVMRKSGETYLIEKGNGCFSLWRYQGSRVVIVSPGQFLGQGSKLVIPETNQRCSIWTVARSKLWGDEDLSPMQLSPD
jgi:hypothetical protein